MGDFYSHLPLNPTLSTSARSGASSSSRPAASSRGSARCPNDLVRRGGAGAADVPRGEPARRGRVELDAGRRPAAGRADDALPADRVLADVRPEHLRHRAARVGPVRGPGAGHHGLGAADALRRPRDGAAITDAASAARARRSPRGLYIRPYAEQSVKALGLEPPPMMWIFEWDIVTGDSAALDSIYAVSRDDLDSAVADGRARDAASPRACATQVAGTDPQRVALPGAVPDVRRRARLRDRPAGHARRLPRVGPAARAVARHRQRDGLRPVARRPSEAFRAARAEHEARYAGDVDLPAYNFTAADLGRARADRDPAMAWLARGLLVARRSVVLVLGARSAAGASRARDGPARRCSSPTTRPWRLGESPRRPTRTGPHRRVGRCRRSCSWPAGWSTPGSPRPPTSS